MGRVLVTMFFMGMIITAAVEIIFGTQRQSRPPVQQMPPQNQYSSQNIP
jgi:Tfp pilus assembly protein PilV